MGKTKIGICKEIEPKINVLSKELERQMKALAIYEKACIEIVWRHIVKDEQPKREDGELVVRKTEDEESYIFIYKGNVEAKAALRESISGTRKAFEVSFENETLDPEIFRKEVEKFIYEVLEGEEAEKPKCYGKMFREDGKLTYGAMICDEEFCEFSRKCWESSKKK